MELQDKTGKNKKTEENINLKRCEVEPAESPLRRDSVYNKWCKTNRRMSRCDNIKTPSSDQRL